MLCVPDGADGVGWSKRVHLLEMLKADFDIAGELNLPATSKGSGDDPRVERH